MAEDNKVPYIFYIYIHYRLHEKFGEKEVSIKDAIRFLFEWRIIKPIRPIIIKELEMMGLVERINKRTIKINRSYFEPENIGEYYRNVGFHWVVTLELN